MAAVSMYETIMSLPLFKGASYDAIHEFVEKTHLSFEKYRPGETIVNADQICHSVFSLLSGSVVSERAIFDGNVIVRETVTAPKMIGIEHLFGMETEFAAHIRAKDQCSVMSFSKTHFLRILHQNELFMLNYLNYLALEAQYSRIALKRTQMKDARAQLAFLVDIATSRTARDIQIECARIPLLEFLHSHHNDSLSIIAKLIEQGDVEMLSDYVMAIKSRHRLINA